MMMVVVVMMMKMTHRQMPIGVTQREIMRKWTDAASWCAPSLLSGRLTLTKRRQ